MWSGSSAIIGRNGAAAVKVAERSGDQVAISAGITAGERVVVEGADQLVDNARVRETQE